MSQPYTVTIRTAEGECVGQAWAVWSATSKPFRPRFQASAACRREIRRARLRLLPHRATQCSDLGHSSCRELELARTSQRSAGRWSMCAAANRNSGSWILSQWSIARNLLPDSVLYMFNLISDGRNVIS